MRHPTSLRVQEYLYQNFKDYCKNVLEATMKDVLISLAVLYGHLAEDSVLFDMKSIYNGHVKGIDNNRTYSIRLSDEEEMTLHRLQFKIGARTPSQVVNTLMYMIVQGEMSKEAYESNKRLAIKTMTETKETPINPLITTLILEYRAISKDDRSDDDVIITALRELIREHQTSETIKF